eukprot:TRINITY_DN78430_c0_g1_i1.p1 TRINITY_DN78430_c0_g1~~TRINITY_DN78430_c0_g1_i1.p1  ORF type:complete len:365 (-),score=69.11 TRINITY_DN78430_c0_g1_i1:37-1080(-)
MPVGSQRLQVRRRCCDASLEQSNLQPRRAHIGLLAIGCSALLHLSWGGLWPQPSLGRCLPAFAMKGMTLKEAWRTLGLPPTATKGELKRAFREKIRQVHPDITGDDGTMLKKVQEALQVVESRADPSVYDSAEEEGLPSWAAGLLQGVKWNKECPSYAAFLEMPDKKALAVGEISEMTGERPWAAAWGKFSQQDANAEALRVCRQYGVKCRLIYVGSGTARARPSGIDGSASEEERNWWREQFAYSGKMPGFGWMPMIDPEKEKLVGYKSVEVKDSMGGTNKIRVPVFEPVHGGIPYFYSPEKPKKRMQMRRTPFKRVQTIDQQMKRKGHPLRELIIRWTGENNRPW